MKTKNLIAIFMILIIFLTSGCNQQTTAPQEEVTGSGRLRFIQCASSADELDLAYQDLNDNNFYLAEENVSYGYQYGYYNLKTGDRVFRLYPTTDNIFVSEGSVTLENGKSYTMLAYDREDTINTSMLVFEDTLVSPDSGKTFVRFINLNADLTDIRIMESGDSTAAAVLPWAEAVKYMELIAGTYRFDVFDSGTQDTLLQTNPITFLSGYTYSVVFSGTLTDLTPFGFNAKVFPETVL